MQILKDKKKKRIGSDETESSRYGSIGYDFFEYEGKPFSGFIVFDEYLNGNIMYEEEYKQGERLGWINEYYESGELKESSLYVGQTCLIYYEYDKEGNMSGDGELQVSKESYIKFVEKYKLLD